MKILLVCLRIIITQEPGRRICRFAAVPPTGRCFVHMALLQHLRRNLFPLSRIGFSAPANIRCYCYIKAYFPKSSKRFKLPGCRFLEVEEGKLKVVSTKRIPRRFYKKFRDKIAKEKAEERKLSVINSNP